MRRDRDRSRSKYVQDPTQDSVQDSAQTTEVDIEVGVQQALLLPETVEYVRFTAKSVGQLIEWVRSHGDQIQITGAKASILYGYITICPNEGGTKEIHVTRGSGSNSSMPNNSNNNMLRIREGEFVLRTVPANGRPSAYYVRTVVDMAKAVSDPRP